MRRLAALVLLLAATGAAQAGEVNALITTAIEPAINELAPPFERETGNTLQVSYGPSGGVLRRFLEGEAADVIVIDSGMIDGLIRQGKVLPDRANVARTAIGIAVRKGAPKPDVSTPEALKRALLAAKTIGHTDPAGGGITAAHITKLFERLGIADQVKSKIRLAAGGPNGRVSVLVSSGEAEIGLQQVSELMSNPDVEVIGMLPDELQQITVYSAAVTVSAKQPAAARALIGALTTPAAMAIYKTKGLAL